MISRRACKIFKISSIILLICWQFEQSFINHINWYGFRALCTTTSRFVCRLPVVCRRWFWMLWRQRFECIIAFLFGISVNLMTPAVRALSGRWKAIQKLKKCIIIECRRIRYPQHKCNRCDWHGKKTIENPPLSQIVIQLGIFKVDFPASTEHAESNEEMKFSFVFTVRC